jgi:hypothetical protein
VLKLARPRGPQSPTPAAPCGPVGTEALSTCVLALPGGLWPLHGIILSCYLEPDAMAMPIPCKAPVLNKGPSGEDILEARAFTKKKNQAHTALTTSSYEFGIICSNYRLSTSI